MDFSTEAVSEAAAAFASEVAVLPPHALKIRAATAADEINNDFMSVFFDYCKKGTAKVYKIRETAKNQNSEVNDMPNLK